MEGLANFTSPDERRALAVVAESFGVVVTETYQFWERAVARILDGTTTDQACPWDVDLAYGEDTIRIEVKYARATAMLFGAGRRPVFRWIDNTCLGTGGADVVVLIGWDDPDLYTWVVPAAVLAGSRAATVTVPSSRCTTDGDRGPLAGWQVPPDQLLPEVLRALRYDREHHARTRAASRAARLALEMDTLF